MRETIFRDGFRAALAVLTAVLVYSLAGQVGPELIVVFNAFSVIVLYFAVQRGEIFGAILGSVCGLAQDAFSLGVFGVSGLTKTLLGYFAGFVAKRVDVSTVPRHGGLALALSFIEVVLGMGLAALVRQEPVNVHGGALFLQPVVTSVLASGAYALERRLMARRTEPG